MIMKLARLLYKIKHLTLCRYKSCKCKRRLFTRKNKYLCIVSGIIFKSKNKQL